MLSVFVSHSSGAVRYRSFKMVQTKTNSSCPKVGEVTDNDLDNFGKIIDLIGGFGFYQKRLYTFS